MVIIDKKVPDFGARAYWNGVFKDVRLSDFAGKWVVLFFYPADFTFVCPTELKELADVYTDLKEKGVEVLSVSKDSEFVHKAWHDASPSVNGVGFPMLSDASGKICKMFGTYIEEGGSEGLSLRGTFLIDPDGILRTMEVHSNSIGRSALELVRKVEAAKFVRENDGEVCPASWQPNKETIKVDVGLVGKI